MRALPFCFLIGILSMAPVAGASPNVLLIMADDLGYSDLGCYGGEIATPNLDRLAAQGIRFTQFYNTARCWPSRAALMTGYYAQQVRRDKIPGVAKSGGRGVRPDWAPLLPVHLKKAGYRCYHTGKWHIDGLPIAGGFDRSYYLKDQGRFFNPKRHWKDDKPLPPVEKGTDFYATTALADHVIECLDEHAEQHAAKPFFHYLAFAAPHFPLHALPEDIARYEGKYDRGWEVLREQRWQKIRAAGLLDSPLSAVERDLGPPYAFPEHLQRLGAGEVNLPLPWAALDAGKQQFQAKKMQLHAAMIDRMDREIGRVLKRIEAMGQLENTLVIFLSDNGASAEIMVRDDGHDPAAAPGSAATYLCLGPGWSTTCNTPFRRHKTWVHEGGISTPLIVSWPKGITARGELRRHPGHIIDIAPTLLHLAGVEPADMTGLNIAPAFARDIAIDRELLWWCHDDHRAVRVGDWKLVAAKGDPWELYDLSRDRAESQDLAAEHPQRVKKMASLWEKKLADFAAQAQKR